MQLQEIFNKVKTHLLSQGKRSIIPWSHGINSAYYGSDGCKCSIGCLIQPEFYSPALEGYAVSRDWVIEALESSGIDVKSLPNRFLWDLQTLHDSTEPCEWEEGLKKIAKNYRLE